MKNHQLVFTPSQVTRAMRSLLPVIGLLLLALPGQAQIVTVPNFSFENPAYSSDHNQFVYNNTQTWGTFAIQDWTFTSPNDAEYGTINYSTDSTVTGGLGNQGAQVVSYYGGVPSYLTSGNTTLNDGTPAGTTGYVTSVLAHATYNLTVGIAVPTGSFGSGTLSLIDSSGNVFASQGFDFSALSSVMSDVTLSFTSSAAPTDLGDGLKIQFGVLNNGASAFPVFDDVRLTASVPEPGTWAMLLDGVGMLLVVQRLRSKRQTALGK
jgi:hypothetical protein